MPNPILTGKVQYGNLIFDRPDLFAIHKSGLEGKCVEVIIRKPANQRTLAMNSYYWGVIVPLIGDHLGYDKDEMHEALKLKFASQPGDHGLTRVESTAKMTVERFIEYTESVKRWAAEFLQVYVPDPGEFI